MPHYSGGYLYVVFVILLLGCVDNTIRGSIDGKDPSAAWIGNASGSIFVELNELILTDDETSRLYFFVQFSAEIEKNVAADWQIKDSSIASVNVSDDSRSVTVLGLKSGSTQLVAKAGEVSATLDIVVVKTIPISPPPPSPEMTSFEWTWMAGPKTKNHFGVYGTKGVADPANFPGSRYFGAHWTDSNGDFWLFGGNGYGESTGPGKMNDLWKYSPSTGNWTWVSGDKEISGQGNYGAKLTPNSTFSPSARHWMTFTKDGTGSFWIVGGIGVDSTGASGYLDDVWKFNPTTTEWTWIAGSSTQGAARVFGTINVEASANTPGAREWGATWVHSDGNLYLFGGSFPGLYQWQGDFWRLNSSTGEWAHIGQQVGTSGGGSFGVKGVSSPTNYPGRRYAGAYWTDPSGNFWLMGGEGNGENGSDNYLNDMWKYDPVVHEWTYMTGGRNGGQALPGVKLSSDPLNTPGQTTVPSWTSDSAGNFYLIAGWGRASSGGEQNLNMLYRFNTTSGEWTWLAGTDGGGMQPNWGVMGTSGASNSIGWREGGGMWISLSGELWYYGGRSLDETSSLGSMIDFWRFF